MKYTFLLILSVIFLSCANTVKETDELSNEISSEEIEKLSGAYKLITLNGKEVSSEDLFLKIDEKGESMVINTACNAIMVDFLQQKKEIKFQQPVSTEMYCEGKMKVEEELKVILPKVSEIGKSAEGLIYFKKDGNVLLTIEKNN